MTTMQISKSAAIRQAKSEVTLDRFGGQWLVMEWDAQAQAWRQGSPRDYARARAARSDEVVRRALLALGVSEWDAEAAVDRDRSYADGGSIEVRVERHARALLNPAIQIATIRIDEDTPVDLPNGRNIVYAGLYRVEMPADYDPKLVTAVDMEMDGSISYTQIG